MQMAQEEGIQALKANGKKSRRRMYQEKQNVTFFASFLFLLLPWCPNAEGQRGGDNKNCLRYLNGLSYFSIRGAVEWQAFGATTQSKCFPAQSFLGAEAAAFFLNNSQVIICHKNVVSLSTIGRQKEA